MEQKDLALVSLRGQNGEQKKEIEELRDRITKFEKDFEDANDPELFRKYKEAKIMNEQLASQLASKNYTMNEKAKDTDIVMEQYEALKNS